MHVQSTPSPQTMSYRRKAIKNAMEEGSWLQIQYQGEDRVVIPTRLEKSSQGKELLKGVLAENSQPRTFRTDRIEKFKVLPDSELDAEPFIRNLPDANGDLARLHEAIADDSKVVLEYKLPRLDKPVTMTVDPEGFDIQPDGSLALEAITQKGNQNSFRLDRICSVDFE